MAASTIRTIWGLAKCKELLLTDDELHWLVAAHTGKDSIRKLSQKEIKLVIGVLVNMKLSATKNKKSIRQISGNVGTGNQRRKIYKLAQALGWQDEQKVNGMCKRMFNIDCVEWLDYKQCSKLIEALKAMTQRADNGGETDERLQD